MEGKRVLVTGGAGFIGSNLANSLAERNDVIAVDDCYLGTPANLTDGVEFVEASVLDDDYPADVDVLFHLAALSSLAMHEDDPQRGARVNVEGFVNAVEKVHELGCDTVVYASTSSIYGSRTDPCSEDERVAAHTGYEASKLARERYAEYYGHAYDVSMAGMRFFSVYQGFEGAEGHKGEFGNIISQFADDLANGRRPVVYGDGSHTRDFTHVSDVVRGLELAADNRLGGIYNLGTGESYSANEVVSLLNETLGTDVEPEYVENPIPDTLFVRHTRADPSKLAAQTGWEPRISFEEGIERVCDPYVD